MNWRKTEAKEKYSDWRKTESVDDIPDWKRSIQIAPKNGQDGKSFEFSEHETEIKKLIQDEVSKIKIPKPKDGDDGINGTKWFILSEKPEDQGVDGDFCLVKDSFDLYVKDSGKWQLKGKLKGPKGSPAVAFNGRSAYEIAQANGFTGTEQEWLSSLSGSSSESFESVSKNLRGKPYTLNYDAGVLTSVVYNLGGSEITKTLNYTLGALTSVVLSGATPSGIQLTKNLNYTSGVLTSVSYS